MRHNFSCAPPLLRAVACVFLFLSLFSLFSCKIQDHSRRVAFLYGISLYYRAGTEGSGPNLRYPDDDAVALGQLLQNSGYEVNMRVSGASGDTPASYPSRAQIKADIESVSAETDRVVIYYSGHGIRNDYGSGIRDYLLPYGSVTSSGGVVPSEMVDAATLHAWLAACPAKQKILIMDSCYSGGFAYAEGDLELCPPIFGAQDPYGAAPAPGILDPSLVSPILARFMSSTTNPSDAIVLSAAGSEEACYESASIGHGIFTGALLDSVAPYEGSSSKTARADKDGDGVVSVLEAFEYAAMAVDVTWNQGAQYDTALNQYSDFFPHVSSGALDSILFSY